VFGGFLGPTSAYFWNHIRTFSRAMGCVKAKVLLFCAQSLDRGAADIGFESAFQDLQLIPPLKIRFSGKLLLCFPHVPLRLVTIVIGDERGPCYSSTQRRCKSALAVGLPLLTSKGIIGGSDFQLEEPLADEETVLSFCGHFCMAMLMRQHQSPALKGSNLY
jgi:hypothetical protein